MSYSRRVACRLPQAIIKSERDSFFSAGTNLTPARTASFDSLAMKVSSSGVRVVPPTWLSGYSFSGSLLA